MADPARPAEAEAGCLSGLTGLSSEIQKYKNIFRSYVWSLSLRITLNLWDTKVAYSTTASCITFNSSYIYLKCRVNQQPLTAVCFTIGIHNHLGSYFFLNDPMSWGKSCSKIPWIYRTHPNIGTGTGTGTWTWTGIGIGIGIGIGTERELDPVYLISLHPS